MVLWSSVIKLWFKIWVKILGIWQDTYHFKWY